MKDKAARQLNFNLKICEIEDNLIRKIQETREKYVFGELEDRYLGMIKKIYEEKDVYSWRGKETSELWERIGTINNSPGDSLVN